MFRNGDSACDSRWLWCAGGRVAEAAAELMRRDRNRNPPMRQRDPSAQTRRGGCGHLGSSATVVAREAFVGHSVSPLQRRRPLSRSSRLSSSGGVVALVLVEVSGVSGHRGRRLSSIIARRLPFVVSQPQVDNQSLSLPSIASGRGSRGRSPVATAGLRWMSLWGVVGVVVVSAVSRVAGWQ